MEAQKPQESARQAEPELLYHYTDQNGLDGILSSDCIWATHYLFMNDLTERKTGIEIYLKTLEMFREAKQYLPPDSIDAWKQILLNYSETCAAFTVSFSRDLDSEKPGQAGDRLSQWRGYSTGRQGYCLGFHRRSIDETSKAMPAKLRLAGFLGDCNYSAEEMVNAVESHTKKHFDNILAFRSDFFRNHPHESSYRPYDDPNVNSAITEYAGTMLFQCSVFKHPGFEEENETRLILIFVDGVSDGNLVEYRAGHMGQTPYIKIPIGIRQDSSLSSIVIGPSAHQEQALAVLRIRLHQMGLRNVEVIPSKIPYRNW